MPLSEDEELELLELENEEALASQKEPVRPVSEEANSNPFSLEQSLPEMAGTTAVGTMLSRFGGPVAMAGAGLAGGYAELGKMAGEAISSSPNVPKTIPESLGRFAKGVYRGAGGEMAGQGIAAIGKALIPSAKTAAQVVRVASGVPEREALAAIKDTKLLGRAKSSREAGKMYQEALADAPYKIESGGVGSRVAFGKTALSPEQALGTFDEILPALEQGKLDLQSAVSLRQTLSHHIGKGKDDWFVEPMRNSLEVVDNYIESKLAKFPDAVKAYREAKIAEEFGSWLPLNKNLSPNVLRTAGALGYAAHGAARGEIMPSIMALGVSPKVWGGAIRAGGAVAPLVKGANEAGSRLIGQAGANYLLPSNYTTEQIRKKYMEGRK